MARKKKVVEVEECQIIGWRCGNCRYWRRLDDLEQMPAEDVLGECLRYPPTIIAVDGGEPDQALPIVEDQHYCGCHQGQVN